MQNPRKDVNKFLEELEELKRSAGRMTSVSHPYAKLSLPDFIYKVSGVPIEGYHDITNYKSTPNTLPYTKVHLDIINKLQDPKLSRLLFLVARQHAKSTIVSELYPAWEILRNPSTRIIVISHGKDLAKASIASTADYLEELGMTFDKNDQEEKIVSRPRVGLRKRDPTLLAYSVDSKMSGRHCDILILDDTVAKENSYTESQRKKYEEFFSAQVSQILESTGRLIVTGVRWRHADYHGVLADPVKHPEFVNGTLIEPACTKEFKNAIWPAKWSQELLNQKRMEIGPLHFAAMFLLDPSGMEGGSFKSEWIFGEGSSEYTELPSVQFNVLGVDPSLGQGQNYFAMCVASKGSDGCLYVTSMFRGDLSTGIQPKTVFDAIRNNQIAKVGIEEVGYQISLGNDLREKIKAANQQVTIEGFKGPMKKEIRLSELAAPLFNGKIKFPSDYKLVDGEKKEVKQPWKTAFTEEYLQFPTGEYDDMLDSLYYAYKMADIYGGPSNSGPKDYDPLISLGKVDTRELTVKNNIIIK